MTPHDHRVAALLDALNPAPADECLVALGHATTLVFDLVEPDRRLITARNYAIALLNAVWRELEATHGHA